MLRNAANRCGVRRVQRVRRGSWGGVVTVPVTIMVISKSSRPAWVESSCSLPTVISSMRQRKGVVSFGGYLIAATLATRTDQRGHQYSTCRIGHPATLNRRAVPAIGRNPMGRLVRLATLMIAITSVAFLATMFAPTSIKYPSSARAADSGDAQKQAARKTHWHPAVQKGTSGSCWGDCVAESYRLNRVRPCSIWCRGK